MCIRTKARQALQAFLYALMFLTRLPVARWLVDAGGQTAVRAVYFYPFAGLVLGLILSLFACCVAGLGAGLAAALTVSVWVLLSGALHLDGLADCVDGYCAGHKVADAGQRRRRILQVMQDPACGAAALVALVLVLLLKVMALASLSAQGAAQALIAAPVLARTLILPFMALADYVGQGSVRQAPKESLWLAAFVYAALAAILLSPMLAFALFAALTALLMYWWRLWQRQIGGYTGDALGALIELAELLVLIVWAGCQG